MYRLRPKAKRDIAQIFKTSLNDFGQSQTEQYYRDLFAAFRQISAHPDLGIEYGTIREGLRGFRMKSHVIFYLHVGASQIDVIRILHKRMDYMHHL